MVKICGLKSRRCKKSFQNKKKIGGTTIKDIRNFSRLKKEIKAIKK